MSFYGNRGNSRPFSGFSARYRNPRPARFSNNNGMASTSGFYYNIFAGFPGFTFIPVLTVSSPTTNSGGNFFPPPTPVPAPVAPPTPAQEQARTRLTTEQDVQVALGPQIDIRTVEEAMVIAVKELIGIRDRRNRNLSPLDARSTDVDVDVDAGNSDRIDCKKMRVNGGRAVAKNAVCYEVQLVVSSIDPELIKRAKKILKRNVKSGFFQKLLRQQTKKGVGNKGMSQLTMGDYTDPPTSSPSSTPTGSPSSSPTPIPTVTPTLNPTAEPTNNPTRVPTRSPTKEPTAEPTETPTDSPTRKPTKRPTRKPTKSPTDRRMK